PGDDLARSFEENDKSAERLGLNFDAKAAPRELARADIEFVIPETQDGMAHGSHPVFPPLRIVYILTGDEEGPHGKLTTRSLRPVVGSTWPEDRHIILEGLQWPNGKPY